MANSKPDILRVSSPSRSYPIILGPGLLDDKATWQPLFQSKQALIVTNEVVAPLYLSKLLTTLSFLALDVVILPDGESHKHQESLFKIYDALIKHHHHRDTTIVALGGGVIGDMAGFAAATYQRGVNFIQVPTTLLAMVDASVGGKTAINYHDAKNMLGAFYQPNAVVMDVSTLLTLPKREWRSGLGEVIKYGLLEGGELWSTLVNEAKTPLSIKTLSFWQKIIAKCCHIKANVVASDERELGSRALLNLGHTFAHALESITHFNHWTHGEAVAIGLYCAALLSYRLGILSEVRVLELDCLLQCVKLANRVPRTLDIEVLIDLMQHDKKIKNNQLRFIVCRDWGHCFIEENVSRSLLKETLYHALEGE